MLYLNKQVSIEGLMWRVVLINKEEDKVGLVRQDLKRAEHRRPEELKQKVVSLKTLMNRVVAK